jgi:hypothetical protein
MGAFSRREKARMRGRDTASFIRSPHPGETKIAETKEQKVVPNVLIFVPT